MQNDGHGVPTEARSCAGLALEPAHEQLWPAAALQPSASTSARGLHGTSTQIPNFSLSLGESAAVQSAIGDIDVITVRQSIAQRKTFVSWHDQLCSSPVVYSNASKRRHRLNNFSISLTPCSINYGREWHQAVTSNGADISCCYR